MATDHEDDLKDEKNPRPLDEDDIALLKTYVCLKSPLFLKTLISYSLPPFPDLLTFIMLRCFPILLFFKLSSLLLSCRVWDLIPQVLKKWRRK